DSVVAEGGFGVVYRAWHSELDITIAVKVLRPVEHSDADVWADSVTKFLQEAKALARIRHPAVVDVLDAGITYPDAFPKGVPWMVLEWLEGETLESELKRRRSEGEHTGRSPRETLELLFPVFEAIAKAHELGIVHRDIKPSNIMLVRSSAGVSARVL